MCLSDLHVHKNQFYVLANYTDPQVPDTYADGRGLKTVGF